MDDFFTIDQPTPPSSSNGLSAHAWVAIGAIDPRLAEPLLSALRSAVIGAYVAPFTSRTGSHLEMRLWVDASLRPEAERVVATTLPELRESLADSTSETDDDRWASIVASLEATSDGDDAPWPAIEGYTSLPDDEPTSYAAPAAPPPSYEDEEEHFVPPDPALPSADPVTKYAWAALLGGIVVLVVPALFGHAVGSPVLTICILAIIAGFLTLVLRLKDRSPDDTDPDDGAVV